MVTRVVATAAALAGAVVLAAAGPVRAEGQAEGKGPVTLPPHVHGQARLDLAVEDGRVEIELTMPGINAVGFEHAPETAEDKAAEAAAFAKLRDGANLFRFPAAAKCKLGKADAKNVIMKHDDDDDDHDHDEAHSKGHEHEHEHGHHHSEFRAHYLFSCASTGNLGQVDLGLFSAFPTLHVVQANTITATGQGAMTLKPGDARLKL